MTRDGKKQVCNNVCQMHGQTILRRLPRKRHEGWVKKAFFIHPMAKIQECSSQSMLHLPFMFYMLQET